MPASTRSSLLVVIIIFFTRTGKSSRESCHVTFDRSLVSQKLHVGTIDQEFALLAFLGVLLATERCEAPIFGHDDLLAAGELVLGAAKGFDCCCAVYFNPITLVGSRYNGGCGRDSSKGDGKKDGRDSRHTMITSPHREQDLANVDTGHGAIGLTPRPTHTGLQSIGAGTGQHLVDTDNMVGVSANAEVKAFFAGNFD